MHLTGFSRTLQTYSIILSGGVGCRVGVNVSCQLSLSLSPESLSQLSSMLTLEGLSGSSFFWNTSLFVLPMEPSLPPVPAVPDVTVVSGDGDGDSDSFSRRLSRSRWRLLWLSDFLVMNRPPSLLCLPPGLLLRSLLSWQSLLRKSMNLMMIQRRGSLSDWTLIRSCLYSS